MIARRKAIFGGRCSFRSVGISPASPCRNYRRRHHRMYSNYFGRKRGGMKPRKVGGMWNSDIVRLCRDGDSNSTPIAASFTE
jgi:hypothetical protein